ncbi:MAG: histidinol-phosphatase [Caldilineaceae bacterium]
MSNTIYGQSTELIRFAKVLADESAQLIRRYFRADYRVEMKSDATPVTIADRQAEEVMRTLIGREFPDHGVLGEEFGQTNPDAEFQWVLDPIDGTKSFVAGSFLFGTLIALVQNGRPILGVINQPLLNDFLVGDGAGCWLNERPVAVRPCVRIEDALLVSTSHTSVAQHHSGVAYDALVQRVQRYRTWGDCHGYYLVATGGADIMTDPILNPWDLMALIPIIEGAGGRITDWRGADVIGGYGAIATAGPIHDEVVRLLNPAAK